MSGARTISKALRRRPVFDRARVAEVQANAILRKPAVTPDDGRAMPRNGGGWLSPRERREVASRLRKADALLREFGNGAAIVSEAAENVRVAIRQLTAPAGDD